MRPTRVVTKSLMKKLPAVELKDTERSQKGRGEGRLNKTITQAVSNEGKRFKRRGARVEGRILKKSPRKGQKEPVLTGVQLKPQTTKKSSVVT